MTQQRLRAIALALIIFLSVFTTVGTGLTGATTSTDTSNVIKGNLTYEDGSNVSGWKVLASTGATSPTVNHTDSSGSFSINVSQNDTYNVWYQQYNTNNNLSDNFPRDGKVDIWALGTANTTAGEDIGSKTVPNGSLLKIEVVDEAGNPIPNRTVFLRLTANGGAAYANGETNDRGQMVLNGSDIPGIEVTGSVDVNVQGGEEYTDNVSTVSVSSNKTYTVVLSKPAHLNGTVTSANGTPTANDTVVVESYEKSFHESLRTNSTGFYSSSVAGDGTYQLEFYQGDVTKGEYRTAPADNIPDLYALGTVSVSGPTYENSTLPDAHNLTIKVVRENGTAVSGADVHIWQERDKATASGQFQTDSNGEVTVELAGDANLRVWPPGDTTLGNSYTAVTADSDKTITITLPSLVTVSGNVTGPNNQVAKGYEVRYRTTDEPYYSDRGYTGATGAYSLQASSNQTYYIDLTQEAREGGEAFADDGIPDIYALGVASVGDTNETRDLEVPYGNDLEIYVIGPGGEPVTDADVHVYHIKDNRGTGVSGTTNTDGQFVINGANKTGIEVNGTVHVHVASPSGSELIGTNAEYTVTSNRSVTIQLEKSVTVSGRVVDASGTAVESDTVELNNYDSSKYGFRTATNADGSFSGQASQNGTFEAEFTQRASDGSTHFPKDGIPDVHPLGTVETGTTNMSLGTFQLPEGNLLNVTVVNQSGAPIEGIDLNIQVEGPETDAWVHGTSNADGQLVLEGAVEPGVEANGSVEIFVDPDTKYTDTWVQVTADSDKSVKIALKPTRNLTTQIKYPNGTPADGERITAYSATDGNGETTWTNETGHATVHVAEDEDQRVGFIQVQNEGDYRPAYPVDGVPDIYALGYADANTTDMGTTTLPSAHNLTVEVVDLEGNPVDARVYLRHNNDNVSFGQSQHTSENGTIGAELVGTLDIYVNPDDSAYGSNRTQIELTNDRTVQIVVSKGVPVTGQLKNPNGTNASGWRITAHSRGGSDSAITAPDGNFTLFVEPGYTYDLGYRQTDSDPETTAFPKDGIVDLYAFDEVDVGSSGIDVGTKQLPRGHLLNVTIVDENGTALSGMKVHAIADNGGSISQYPAHTNEQGKVVLNGADKPGIEVNGTIRLSVEGTDNYGEVYEEYTVTNDTNIQIVMKEPAYISGQFVDEEGHELTDSVAIASGSDTWDVYANYSTGNFTFTVTEDGPVDINFVQRNSSTGWFPRDNITDLYTTTSVTIDNGSVDIGKQQIPDSAGILDVKVVDQEGNPVENASVIVWTAQTKEYGVGFRSYTDNGGFYSINGQRGIEVNGSYTIEVKPPEDATEFKDATYTRNVTVTGDTVEEITLQPNVSTAPANLTIQSVDAPSEVVQGAPVTVNATVENVGDTDGTRDVTLTVGDEATTHSVTVAAGETANVSLQVPTSNTPVGTTDYEVTTSTDTATGSITILEPANTSIDYELNTTEPLTNESLQVTATVNNTGDVEGDAPVTLYVDDQTAASKTVTVAAHSSETVTFNVNLERGDHSIRVNELESRTVTAVAPPNLTVSYTVNTTTILTNESAAITATIENSGDLTGSTTVNFTVNGSVVASKTVTVAGQSSETVTHVPDLPRGTNTVAVNDKESTIVEVRKPADVNVVAQNVTTVEFLSTNPLNVTVYLNNTGDLDGSTTVPLVVDGETIATKTVSVPANTVGENNSDLEAVQFSVERNWETYGDHLVHAGDLANVTVTILRPTNPDTTAKMVSPVSDSVVNSSDVTVEYEVTNTSTGVSAIEVQIDDGGWQESIGSTVTRTLDDGEHTARVRVIDNLGDTIATAKTTFTVDTEAPSVTLQTKGPASPNSPADITVISTDLTQNTTVVEVRDGEETIYREDVSDEVLSDTEGVNTALTTWNGTNQSGAAVPSRTYTVAVISTDKAGHTNETTTSVLVDTDRPQVNVTDVNAGDGSNTTFYVNQSDVITMTLETSDPTTNVTSTSAIVQSRSSSFQAFVAASETATDGVWTATVDVADLGGSGNYSVGGLVTDEAQNVRPRYNDTVTIVVDETSPTMGATVSQVDQTTGRVNITSSEPLTATPDATVKLPNGTTETVSLSETARGWTGTFSLPEDGSYQITVNGTDRAGNTGETRASTNVKTNVNTINKTATIRNNETGTFIELHTENDVSKAFAALTESDSPLAALSEDLSGSKFIDGQLGQQLNDNLSYAVIGMPVNESELPDGVEPEDVEIRFYNETTGEWETVGNTTIEEREFNGMTQRFYTVNVSHFSTYGAVAPDDTAPSLGETTVSPTGSPYAYDTETASVQFNYSDTQSGVNTSAVKVWVDGEPVTDGQSSDTTLQVTSESTTVELTNLEGSGDHSVTVQVVDEAGNTAPNATKSFTVTEDTTSPSVTTDFEPDTTFDYGTSQVNLALALSDTQSGVDASGITVTVDGADVTGPALITENEISYTATDLEAGSHTFTVTVPDEEGNVETITRTFTIDDDTDAPTIETATVSPASDSGLLPADTTTLTLSADYSDVESGVVASDVVVEFSDGSGWTEVTDTAIVTSNETTYTAYDLTPGTYTFRVTVPDAAGNTNEITKQVTIGEGTTPSFTDVELSPSTGSDPLPANTSQVTINVGFTDAEGDIDTIDAQFDGESVSPVHDDDQVSYTATGLKAGTNHTLTVRITDRGGHTITKTVSFAIAAETTQSNTGGGSGGGGGGGGGSSSGSAALSLNVIPVSDGATVRVRDTDIGATGTADLGDAVSGAGVTVNAIELAMKFDSSRFRVEVSTPTADGPAAPQGTTIGSFSANAIGVDSSKLGTQTLTFSVDESALPEGASLEDVALFVKTDDGWSRVEVGQNGGTFTAETDTLGTFAVAALTDAAADSTETTETATPTATATESPTATATESPTETATQTEQPTTDQPTETNLPGLGIMHAVAALAAALLVIRRWKA